MQDAFGDNIEFYIGSQIEYESERVVLRQVVNTLNTNNLASVVIANVNLSCRQIDLIVATENQVLVVEAKKTSSPLRGSENGFWEFRATTGEWRTITNNYYQQTLNAKNALRDAMQKFSTGQVNYPEAALVFATPIPNGSNILSSDFKVHIGNIELLKSFNRYKKDSTWSLAQWRKFAQKHNFIKVDNLNAAFDDKLIDSALILDRYRASFSKFYGPQVQDMISFPCHIDDNTVTSNDVVSRSVTGESVLIVGPSGCGKSMLGRHIALSLLESGTIPIFVEAKYFQKELGPVLSAEIALLGCSSIGGLLSACSTYGTSIAIILDGFNECPPSLRQRLYRCLNAMALRYQVNLIVTSQTAFPELTQLGLTVVHVSEPDMNLKLAIANLPDDESVTTKTGELLSLARSGLEANIIGQISKTTALSISRYALFDAYIRKLLGDVAQDAIKILAQVGRYFVENISFSMSVREFDRLLEARGWSSSITRQLITAHFLHERGDRISFGHELYLNAFSAEAVIRTCGDDADRIASAISAPKHHAYKNLILGAIDNVNLLNRVLQRLEDVEIIISCAAGECGVYAREWVDHNHQMLLKNMKQEAKSVTFRIDENGWMNVSPEPQSLYDWSKQDNAFITALSVLLAKGKYLDQAFEIVGVMDENLQESFEHLIEEARQKKIALRSGLFASGLDNQNSTIAISRTIARIGNSISSNRQRDSVAISVWVKAKLAKRGMSNGQVFMLLKICRHILDIGSLATNLPNLILERWKYAPYHLRIAILDAAQCCWNCNEEERRALVDAINTIETNNIWISTSVIDALKSLGALEEIDYEETVRCEVEEALSDPENSENWSLARSLYNRQFDHPYDHLYWEVLHDLPDMKRKELLVLAVRAKDDFYMFVPCMITDLAEFGDRNTGKYIEHWTELPPKNNPMPQDAVGVFVISHIVLGRLRHPLHLESYDHPDECNAMLACGELYYWLNREDLDTEKRAAHCNRAWEILLRHELGVSLSALKECEETLKEGLKRLVGKESVKESIIQSFPDEALEISRHALLDGITQYSSHPWIKQEEILSFAVSILGFCGKSTDLTLVRSMVDDRYLGSNAVRAVKQLEERLVNKM